MRVGVIGAGVVGLTTAHNLQEQGADVSVIEAAASVGCGASFANAGQLAWDNATPLGSPDLLRQLAQVLVGRSRGVSVRLSPELRYLRWALAFLYQSLPTAYRKNADTLAAIASRAAERMQRYHDEFGCEYNHRRAGKIVLHEQPSNCASRLSRESLLDIEPALAHWQAEYASGSFAPHDEVGDARRFAQALWRRLSTGGTRFEFGVEAHALKAHAHGWTVQTSAGNLRFDKLVLCNGNGASRLLTSVGQKVPVYPVAGFSYTFPAGEHANQRSITIADHKIVYSRLGEQVRVAGYAHINGSKQSLQRHARQMLQMAQNIAPGAARYNFDQAPWIGFRPTTPNSVPLVGASPIPGLYYNFGHGMLGWTLCAATAEMVVNAMAE